MKTSERKTRAVSLTCVHRGRAAPGGTLVQVSMVAGELGLEGDESTKHRLGQRVCHIDDEQTLRRTDGERELCSGLFTSMDVAVVKTLR